MKLAREVMTTQVISARPQEKARSVLLQILIGQYSGMPVINERSEVVGVVSEFDLVKAIQKKAALDKISVAEIMTRDPHTVDVSEPIQNVIDVMIEKGFLRLPVTENGKLAGVISRSDILKSYYETEQVSTIY